MTVPLKPYSTGYTDSGVEWLGCVPEHWEVLPNRAVFSEVKQQGYEDEQMLSVTISRGVIPQDELLEGTSKKDQSRLDKSAYKLIQPGDISYNKMRAWQGAIGVSEYRGIISPAYVAQRPLGSITATYMHYLFRTPIFTKEVERFSYGITSDMWSLRPEDFKVIYVCIPPLPEQTAIARYLDYATGCIDRYIRAKEKLISLLAEQKRVIIHQAVTGQIDVRTGKPYPAYKDSGVEWLGEVPGHWEMRRLGQIGSIFKGRGGSKEDEVSQGISCIRYGDLYTTHDYFIFRSRSYVSREIATQYTSIRFGDVLFATSGETIEEIGKSAVNLVRSEVCCGGDVVVFRSKRKVNAKYIGYATDCTPSACQKSTMGRGITVMHIYSNQLKRLSLALPPLTEQIAIARFLDKTSSRIDGPIDRAQRQIDLLREYRERLISDVVTGKLDVREAAARLPQEADKPASIDNSDDLADREEGYDEMESTMIGSAP